MISGALLQRYCPDNGQCTERTDSSAGGGDSRRRLLALLLGRGSSASGSGGWLRSLAEGPAGGESVPGGDETYVCNGRALWSIVGAITLSSPLLVLLTQVGCMAGCGEGGSAAATKAPLCRCWRDVAACRRMLLLWPPARTFAIHTAAAVSLCICSAGSGPTPATFPSCKSAAWGECCEAACQWRDGMGGPEWPGAL